MDPFLFLCLIGVEEGELLGDELEKGFNTIRCGEQFRPTPFPLGLFTDTLSCFVVFLLMETHSYKCCVLFYIVALPVHLQVEGPGLCSAAADVAVVMVCHHCHW